MDANTCECFAAGVNHALAWRPILACFLLALFAWSLGFYGQAAFLAELLRTRGWSGTTISAATTAYYLMGAAFLALVPTAFSRLGERASLLGGIVLLAGGAACLPFLTAPWMLFAVAAPMAAGWALTSGTAVTLLLAPRFQAGRAMALGWALQGASVAGFTAVPLFFLASSHVGFALAAPAFAAAMALPALAGTWLLPPPGRTLAEAERRQGGPARFRDRGHALGSRAFWSFAGPVALGQAAQVGFLMHQLAFLRPLLGVESAALAQACTTLAAMLGRFALGYVAPRLDLRAGIAFCFGSQALALAVMLVWPQPLVLLAACALFGFSVGNAITLPPLLIGQEVAEASFALAVGLSTAVAQVAYAFGPVVVGGLADATGGYDAAFLVCMACQVGGAVSVLRLRPSRPAPG